jgi:predicted dehydrogenase
MAAPLNVALLGCGALAEILARRVYPQVTQSIRITAAVDISRERANAVGKLLGAPGFSTLRDAADSVPLDAVDVRLPHHLHLQGAELAAELGLPFLIEKPMAHSFQEASKIAALADQVDGPCGVSENYGFLEPVRAAADLLRTDAIGQLLAVQSTRVFELAEQWRRDGWRVTSRGPAGVLVDQATHVARMLRTVVGEIAEVHAYSTAHRDGFSNNDSAVVACRFASGHIGTQLYCWACPTPAAPEHIAELSLYGAAGSISVYISYNGEGGGALLQRPGATDEWHGSGTNYYDSLARTLEEWADAVVAGREPTCSISEGLTDVAVLQAIKDSQATGTPARVAPVRARC